MPIFISYSHADKEFVDMLAANLVREKHHIWMDRWELNVGDSLTEKIEKNLSGSSAMLVILSENSVNSPWCKRELTAGLVRELEERKTIVLPCVLDDCKIPLFLRDKMYADFRKDPDEAFELVDRALARVSNPSTSREETPNFYTDYAFDWKAEKHSQSDESWVMRWTFVDHGHDWPYVVVSELKAYAIDGVKIFEAALAKDEQHRVGHRLMHRIVERIDEEGGKLNGVIQDVHTQLVQWRERISKDETYVLIYSYRRLGLDNGMNTVVHLDNNLRMALKHFDETLGPLP